MTASSRYLDLPTRSEAEAILDRVKNLRAQVQGFEMRIKADLRTLGVTDKDMRFLSFVDDFNENLGDIESNAKEAIHEADCRDEFEHIESERKDLAWRI